MVSVCLSSDALSQHLLSYLGFSYLGHGVSLHGCSSKAQSLLLTLDGYLLTATPPDVERGVAPLGPPGDLGAVATDEQTQARGPADAPALSIEVASQRFWAEHSFKKFMCLCTSKTVGVARGHQRADTLKS